MKFVLIFLMAVAIAGAVKNHRKSKAKLGVKAILNKTNRRAVVNNLYTRTSQNRVLTLKRKIFSKSADAKKQTRDLRQCYVENTGECCANNIADCRYYRRYYRSQPRTNIFFMSMMPFMPGNFWYQSCTVQCICSTYQSSCSVAPAPPTSAATTAAATTTPATTTTPVVTTVTTAVPTTAAVTRFCPASVTTQPNVSRILAGTAVTDCTAFPGVVSVVEPASGTTVCTGVVTAANTVSIPNGCAQFLSSDLELREPISGNTIETIPADTAASSLTSGGPYTITTTTTLTASSCPGIACIYDASMVNDIDLANCVVVGAGYDTNAGTNPASLSFMPVSSLEPTATCPALLQASAQSVLFNFSETYNCFFGTGGASSCAGDAGAPVMCPLSSGELVVIGQVENMPCDGTGAEIIGLYNLETASILRVFGASSHHILGRRPGNALKNKNKGILLGNHVNNAYATLLKTIEYGKRKSILIGKNKEQRKVQNIVMGEKRNILRKEILLGKNRSERHNNVRSVLG